ENWWWHELCLALYGERKKCLFKQGRSSEYIASSLDSYFCRIFRCEVKEKYLPV
ncbi:hypothetical protein K7432_017571, partial [Basidiobolus ranarum]